MNFNIDSLETFLEEKTGELFYSEIDDLDPTQMKYDLSSEEINLIISINKKIFTILDFEVTTRYEGIGPRIFGILENYCVSNDYHEIIADDVTFEGVGFWEKQGFEPQGKNHIKYL